MIGTNDPAKVDEVLAALANPTRRKILELLLSHSRLPVSSLSSRFDMARPSVSEHLRVLRDVGLVSERRSGRQRLYRLDPEPLIGLRNWLRPYEEFWQQRLDNLRILLDEEE